METIIYKEKQTTYPIFYIILILEFPLILYFIFNGLQQKQYGLTALIAVIFVFLIFILVNFFHLRIRVYEDKIVFYFGIFDKIIHFSDIQRVEIQDYDFWKYWGWGIRWSPFVEKPTLKYPFWSGRTVCKRKFCSLKISLLQT